MDKIAIGDLVIRKSHGGDIVFKVTDIFADDCRQVYCIIKGLHLRLLADAPLEDLVKIDADHLRQEILALECTHNDCLRRVMKRRFSERREDDLPRAGKAHSVYSFFELPGKVLHLDGDEEYLNMCLKTYDQLNIEAEGRWIAEEKQPEVVVNLVRELQPDILVLTGHDALVGNGKKDFRDMNNYRNSRYFVQAVKMVRQYSPCKDNLVIFAGACQSYFEAILAAGANFASSPTRIFIHAYDPVFIVEKVAFTPISKMVDANDAIAASITGPDGVGGMETRGKFRMAAPKTPY